MKTNESCNNVKLIICSYFNNIIITFWIFFIINEFLDFYYYKWISGCAFGINIYKAITNNKKLKCLIKYIPKKKTESA